MITQCLLRKTKV